MSHWPSQHLAILRRLRERFLARTAGERDYWKSPEELALYDSTFGERIGWKWDAVLAELATRNWQPRSKHVLDWGCGSGIAGRRVLAQWPHLETLTLHDRSRLACRFAAERARAAHPRVSLRESREIGPDTLLVLSHVLSELPPAELAAVLALARKAREVIWVEAGTHEDSRRLIAEVREVLLPQFAAVAPCTHQSRCGMLATGNAPHWCHHFAPVPSEIFRDGKWMEFGRDLKIDLRSLPYSFLVLQNAADHTPLAPDFSRVIGRPREATGYCKILSCHENGVKEFVLQKRDAPELHRAFRKGTAETTYRWAIENGRIAGGETLPETSRENSI